MAAKPRYWHIAYPLSVVALCVAPRDYFQRNWTVCLEAGLAKLKVRFYSTLYPLQSQFRIWFVGQAISCTGAQRDTTLGLDLSISDQRIRFNGHNEDGNFDEALFPA